ncbi:MAG TPA: hypothetical protein VGI71_06370 [Scandinavium sp.]|jgi:hypothetical protein
MTTISIKDDNESYRSGIEQLLLELFLNECHETVGFMVYFGPGNIRDADVVVLGLCLGRMFITASANALMNAIHSHTEFMLSIWLAARHGVRRRSLTS